MHDLQASRRSPNIKDQQSQLLAYEIHDGLCQYLAAAIGYLNVYRESENPSSDQANEYFDTALRLLDKAMEESRGLVARIRRPLVNGCGIVKAVERLISESHWRDRLSVVLQHHVPPGALSAIERDAVFRIIQEGLTNVARHSNSPEVHVNLTCDDSRVHIEIEDFGKGFDPDKVAGDRFGLEGMRHESPFSAGI